MYFIQFIFIWDEKQINKRGYDNKFKWEWDLIKKKWWSRSKHKLNDRWRVTSADQADMEHDKPNEKSK